MSYEVAYGVPAAVGEARLLEALRAVTDNFDDSPVRMLAVLGPPDRGMRWMTFACSSLGAGTVLAQDHFTESIRDIVPELVVVTRMYTYEPSLVTSAEVVLERVGTDGPPRAVVRRRALPEGTRRDGEIDQIALAALGMPDAIRPFEALDAPTHQVVLRDDRARPEALAIEPYAGKALPCKVEARLRAYGDIVEEFPLVPRAVADDDRAALALHLNNVCSRADQTWTGRFDHELPSLVRELVRIGPAIAPLVEDALTATPAAKPRPAVVMIAALAQLGHGAHAILGWAVKTSAPLALAAHAALARLGEAARPVLAAARSSGKRAIRDVGDAMIAMLDDRAWEPVRAARGRGLYIALGACAGETFPDHARRRALDAAPRPAALWELAAFVIDQPTDEPRHELMREMATRAGAELGPVADLLLRFPPFANDPVIGAIARGEPPPTSQQVIYAIIDAREKRVTAKKTAAKKKPR